MSRVKILCQSWNQNKLWQRTLTTVPGNSFIKLIFRCWMIQMFIKELKCLTPAESENIDLQEEGAGPAVNSASSLQIYICYRKQNRKRRLTVKHIPHTTLFFFPFLKSQAAWKVEGHHLLRGPQTLRSLPEDPTDQWEARQESTGLRRQQQPPVVLYQVPASHRTDQVTSSCHSTRSLHTFVTCRIITLCHDVTSSKNVTSSTLNESNQLKFVLKDDKLKWSDVNTTVLKLSEISGISSAEFWEIINIWIWSTRCQLLIILIQTTALFVYSVRGKKFSH